MEKEPETLLEKVFPPGNEDKLGDHGENLSEKPPVGHLIDCLEDENLPIVINTIRELNEKGFIEDYHIKISPGGDTMFYLKSAGILPQSKLNEKQAESVSGIKENWPPNFKTLKANGIKPDELSLQANKTVKLIVLSTTLKEKTFKEDLDALCKEHETDPSIFERIIEDNLSSEYKEWVAVNGEKFHKELVGVIKKHQSDLNSKHSDLIINIWNNFSSILLLHYYTVQAQKKVEKASGTE